MVASILAAAEHDVNGCLVTHTVGPRKVRFRGKQDRAYRFVFCVTNDFPAGYHEVVRHRCKNRRYVNPDHLMIGTRANNLGDHRQFGANGMDFDLL